MCPERSTVVVFLAVLPQVLLGSEQPFFSKNDLVIHGTLAP